MKSAMLPMLFVLGLLSGCAGGGVNLDIPGLGGKASDEAQITKILNDVHLGMETKKVGKIMRHVSADYLDEEGRDAEGIRKYLNQVMNNYRSIQINRSASSILIQGDRARVVEAFGTLGQPDNSQTPPVTLQGQVAVYLQRTDAGWKIVEWGAIS
ncbi:MAG: hypothetical protein JNK74_18430 [Candidatus Hydrogenedentes bacterium]|nr:hypothetical protein [Candidatus Hydrogenedentota bacterium]